MDSASDPIPTELSSLQWFNQLRSEEREAAIELLRMIREFKDAETGQAGEWGIDIAHQAFPPKLSEKPQIYLYGPNRVPRVFPVEPKDRARFAKDGRKSRQFDNAWKGLALLIKAEEHLLVGEAFQAGKCLALALMGGTMRTFADSGMKSHDGGSKSAESTKTQRDARRQAIAAALEREAEELLRKNPALEKSQSRLNEMLIGRVDGAKGKDNIAKLRREFRRAQDSWENRPAFPRMRP